MCPTGEASSVVAGCAKPNSRHFSCPDPLDGRTQVGHDGGSCVIFGASKIEENCTMTSSLPDGDIMTQFLNSPPPAKTFAVTGRTGIYRNMRGQGELVESGHETATLSFDLIG